MVLNTILIGIILAVIIAIGLIILFKAAGIIVKILLHMGFGLILLFIVDLIPFVHVPINCTNSSCCRVWWVYRSCTP